MSHSNPNPNPNFSSLRKQSTFGDVTTGFPAKWHLRNERRNSIRITRHYPDLGSSSDWLNQISHAAWPIRCTTQTWVVMHHQYGNSCAHFSDIISGGKPVVAPQNLSCFPRLHPEGLLFPFTFHVFVDLHYPWPGTLDPWLCTYDPRPITHNTWLFVAPKFIKSIFHPTYLLSVSPSPTPI